MKNLGDIFNALNSDREAVLEDKLSVAQYNSRTAGFGKIIKLLSLELSKRQFGYKANSKLSNILDG